MQLAHKIPLHVSTASAFNACLHALLVVLYVQSISVKHAAVNSQACSNPMYFVWCGRPADLGIDVVCESATKYLNGHSDVTAGVVAGSAEFIKRVQHLHLPLEMLHAKDARPV